MEIEVQTKHRGLILRSNELQFSSQLTSSPRIIPSAEQTLKSILRHKQGLVSKSSVKSPLRSLKSETPRLKTAQHTTRPTTRQQLDLLCQASKSRRLLNNKSNVHSPTILYRNPVLAFSTSQTRKAAV